jgi:hypothetical protein
LKPLALYRKGEVFLEPGGLSLEGLPGEFQKNFPDISPKYIDAISLLAGIAAGRALRGAASRLTDAERLDFAVILGSAFGAIDSTVEFDTQALLKGPNAVNPMDFPNTVANAAGSRIGIWLQLKGPNVTLTNGGTSLIDALGFALQGYNAGLFTQCLAGAADKVPAFLKPLAGGSSKSPEVREGACFLWASGGKSPESPLFQAEDAFAAQLKPDGGLPPVLTARLEKFWEGAEWLGFPGGTPFESRLPRGPFRFQPPEEPLELGFGGLNSLEAFLRAPHSRGVLGAYSSAERKISLIKVNK